MLTDSVSISHALCECINPDGSVKPVYRNLMASLNSLGVPELQNRWRQAKDSSALDAFTFLLDPKEFRTVPTDWIPRLIPAEDWDTISRGVAQRLKAINRFLMDLYCGQQNIVPPDVMFSCQFYNPDLQDFRPPPRRVRSRLRHRSGAHGRGTVRDPGGQPAHPIRYHLPDENH